MLRPEIGYVRLVKSARGGYPPSNLFYFSRDTADRGGYNMLTCALAILLHI